MPQPEQLKQKKNNISQANITKYGKAQEKVFTKQISTSAKEQNCPTICNTETKHQQILRRKTKLNLNIQQRQPLEAAKTPRQMSLFIRQAQITSKPRRYYKKHPQLKENTTRLYPERKPKTNSEQSNQKHYNFQLNLNKQV